MVEWPYWSAVMAQQCWKFGMSVEDISLFRASFSYEWSNSFSDRH
jgi:hypothetical protein